MTYQRPPIAIAVDPNRMNWIWKLICALERFTAREVVEACARAGIALPKNRVKAWSYAEGNPDFSAMNATELERTLRALIDARRAARLQDGAGAPLEQSQERAGEECSNAEFDHYLRKCRDAMIGGRGAWSVMSTGEKVAVALALNRADWLAEIDYSIPQAIERTGGTWMRMLPLVVRALGDV